MSEEVECSVGKEGFTTYYELKDFANAVKRSERRREESTIALSLSNGVAMRLVQRTRGGVRKVSCELMFEGRVVVKTTGDSVKETMEEMEVKCLRLFVGLGSVNNTVFGVRRFWGSQFEVEGKDAESRKQRLEEYLVGRGGNGVEMRCEGMKMMLKQERFRGIVAVLDLEQEEALTWEVSYELEGAMEASELRRGINWWTFRFNSAESEGVIPG